MPKLYSYTVAVDHGSAPNPFGGVCTLVICKPKIRQSASVGDWIAGTGSKNSPAGDLSNALIYAMKVTKKMTMQEYDRFTKKHLTIKLPDWSRNNYRKMAGDSIFDFSKEPPRMRQSAHSRTPDRIARNTKRDLSGEYAILSSHFYYFGREAIAIPKRLRQIINRGQGHRSRMNEPYLQKFVDWLESLEFKKNRVHGKPAEPFSTQNTGCCDN